MHIDKNEKMNNSNDFFNAFGDLLGKFAKEFGGNSSGQSTGGTGSSFIENSAREQARQAKMQFDKLKGDGFSDDHALRVVAMMSKRKKR